MCPVATSACAAAAVACASPRSTASRRGIDPVIARSAASVRSLETPSWYTRIATWPSAPSTVGATVFRHTPDAPVGGGSESALAPALKSPMALAAPPASTASSASASAARLTLKILARGENIERHPKWSLTAPRWSITVWGPGSVAGGHTHPVPTVLITGASTGIGRATTLRLATSGWTVLAGVRKAQDGERARGRGRRAGRPDHPRRDRRRADRRRGGRAGGRAGASRRARQQRRHRRRRAAGAGTDRRPAQRQFDVNVLAQIAVTRAMLPALRRARGRIVFVSSIGGRVAMAFTAPYAASKHAIEAIGDALRVELRSSGIQVALIEPGSVTTPIWDKSRAQGDGLSVPAELTDQYGHVQAAMSKVLHDTERRGIPPEQVAADDRAGADRAADEGPLRDRPRRKGDAARRQATVAGPRVRPRSPSARSASEPAPAAAQLGGG